MDVDERRTLIAEEFASCFGALPTFWARAPGRVDLMGSHTDYNLGYVMTMAVDRDTWLAASPRMDRRIRIASLNLSEQCEFSLDDVGYASDESSGWTAYVRGVAHVLQATGQPLTGFDGVIHSTLPLGGGLSSSAALEMVTLVGFQQVSGFRLEAVEMARFGQQAENEYVGVSCGILDQYSSVMGRQGSALLLDCKHLTSRNVPIHADLTVVICDTKAERQLGGTEYAERRRQCEEGVRLIQKKQPNIASLRDVNRALFDRYKETLPQIVARRCQFIIEENHRVLEMMNVLPRGDRQQLYDLFHTSYVGARDLYEIGAPAMESMMDAMLQGPGVIAARQAGAGFGGCMVALVETSCVQQFASSVAEVYAGKVNVRPHIFEVAASPGAGMLSY